MAIISKATILGWLDFASDDVISQVSNLLESFFHKAEGKIVKSISELEGYTTITFSDDTTQTFAKKEIIDMIIAGQVSGYIARKNRADLPPVGDADTAYLVLDDSVSADNNGTWGWDGSVYYQAVRTAETLERIAGDALKVDISSIVNNVTTNDSSKVLSAAQGFVLNNKLATITSTGTWASEIEYKTSVIQGSYVISAGNVGASAILDASSKYGLIEITGFTIGDKFRIQSIIQNNTQTIPLYIFVGSDNKVTGVNVSSQINKSTLTTPLIIDSALAPSAVKLYVQVYNDAGWTSPVDFSVKKLVGYEASINERIELETTNRIASISAETSARNSAISAETSARIASISAETSARNLALSSKSDIAYVNGYQTTLFKAVQIALKSIDNNYILIGFANTTSNITSKQKETTEGVYTSWGLELNDVVKPLYSGTFTNFLDANSTPIVVPSNFNSYIIVRGVGFWNLVQIKLNEDLTRLITTQSLLTNNFQKLGTNDKFYNGTALSPLTGAFATDKVLVKEGETIIFKTNSYGSNKPITFFFKNGTTETYAPTGNPNIQTLEKIVPTDAVSAIFSTTDKNVFKLKYKTTVEIDDFNYKNLTKYNATDYGDNLINPYDLIPNTAITKLTGGTSTISLWWASDFIPVEEGVTYVIPNLHSYAPYDSSKVFVDGADMSEQTILFNIGDYFFITIPVGVSYIRVSRGANSDVLALRITVAKFYKDPTHQSFSFDFNKGLFPHLKMPFKGKKVTIVGDSYSDQGRWLYALLSITGLQIRVNIGQSGAPMVRFPYNMSQIQTEIEESDLIIIMGGTNDYGIISNTGNATYPTVLGSPSDSIRDLATIISNGATTYSASISTAMKECALVVDTYNSNARILFVSEPERGVFGNMYGLIPPALNSNGLNLANISDKIEEVCKTFGYDFFNFHQKGWRLSQINKYSDDSLHPNSLGADLLGGMLGKYINETYSYFGI